MAKKIFSVVAVFLILLSACTGVKKVSGTLTKSDERNDNRYSKHGDYLNRSDTLSSQPVKYKPALTERDSRSGNRNTYRRDYNRLSEPVGSDKVDHTTRNARQDYNQQLVDQYQEMDRMGEVVLYEISVIEKRWDILVEQYKRADATEKDQIARELDGLDSDRLILYKAYTRIYKQGKTDWPAAKKDVETILLSLRGVK